MHMLACEVPRGPCWPSIIRFLPIVRRFIPRRRQHLTTSQHTHTHTNQLKAAPTNGSAHRTLRRKCLVTYIAKRHVEIHGTNAPLFMLHEARVNSTASHVESAFPKITLLHIIVTSDIQNRQRSTEQLNWLNSAQLDVSGSEWRSAVRCNFRNFWCGWSNLPGHFPRCSLASFECPEWYTGCFRGQIFCYS